MSDPPEFDNAIPPNSAVQIGHKRTGIAVDCADERSEQKNKVKAMKALRSRLLPKQEKKTGSNLLKR
jgi:protein subunit release factor A